MSHASYDIRYVDYGNKEMGVPVDCVRRLPADLAVVCQTQTALTRVKYPMNLLNGPSARLAGSIQSFVGHAVLCF